MPSPSSKSKQRWNASHYRQLKISVNPDTATLFKAACAANNVSMAGVLSKFMDEYSHTDSKGERQSKTGPRAKDRPLNLFETRRKRHDAVNNIKLQMEQLMIAEERYRDAIPENLQGSKWYDAADHSIELIQEIIELLSEAY